MDIFHNHFSKPTFARAGWGSLIIHALCCLSFLVMWQNPQKFSRVEQAKTIEIDMAFADSQSSSKKSPQSPPKGGQVSKTVQKTPQKIVKAVPAKPLPTKPFIKPVAKIVPKPQPIPEKMVAPKTPPVKQIVFKPVPLKSSANVAQNHAPSKTSSDSSVAGMATSSLQKPALGNPVKTVSTVPTGGAGGNARATILHKPSPFYPAVARRMGRQGKVLVKLHISKAGVPEQVTIIEPTSFPPLNRAAIETAKQYRFKPALKSGVAIQSTMVVAIIFQLS